MKIASHARNNAYRNESAASCCPAHQMTLPLPFQDFGDSAHQLESRNAARIASQKHHMSRIIGQVLHSGAKVSVSNRATVVVALVAWRGDGTR